MAASVALADEPGEPGIDRAAVEVDEGDPELEAEGVLELALGDVAQLDQDLAERCPRAPLGGEGRLQLGRRHEVRLDKDVPEEMLPAVLGQDDVQLVRREQLLLDEQLPEQGPRLGLLLDRERAVQLDLVDQAVLDQEPAQKWMSPRTVGGRRRAGVDLRYVHRVPPRCEPCESRPKGSGPGTSPGPSILREGSALAKILSASTIRLYSQRFASPRRALEES
jgi:hypothetical protein